VRHQDGSGFCSSFAPFQEQGSKALETGRSGVALQRRRKRYRLELTSMGRSSKLLVAGSILVSRSIVFNNLQRVQPDNCATPFTPFVSKLHESKALSLQSHQSITARLVAATSEVAVCRS
jgi:hypothetical protein